MLAVQEQNVCILKGQKFKIGALSMKPVHAKTMDCEYCRPDYQACIIKLNYIYGNKVSI